MRTQKTALTVLFAFFISIALPAIIPPALAQTQAQMNQMAFRDEAKADAALNVVYKKLMAKLDAPGEAQLRRAQRAWIVFRDAEATFEASQETGGTMYPTVHANFVEEITEARTKQLKTTLEGLQNDGR